MTTRNLGITSLSAGLIVLLAFLGFRTLSDSNGNSADTPVVATVYAYAALSEELLGEDQVTWLGEGQDLHDYEPTPQDLRILEDAELLVASGGVDEWAVEARDGGYIEAISVIENPLEGGAHDHGEHDGEDHEEGEHGDEEHSEEHEEGEAHSDEDHKGEEGEHSGEEHHEEEKDSHSHDHGDIDPHAWTVPGNLVQIGAAILEERGTEDTNEYLTLLTDLDSEYRQRLSGCAQDTVLTTHDALSYLGVEYDFEIVAAGTQEGELDLGPQELAGTLETIEETDVSYILVSPLENQDLAQTLATEADLTILPINLLENTPDGGLSLEEALRQNLDSLATALECER